MRARWALMAMLAILAAAPRAGADAGGTTFAVNGPNVTITVNFDLCCIQGGAEQAIYGPRIAAQVTAAQDMWNAALANLPGKGCYNLKVVFNARLLKRGDRWDPDYHRIDIDFQHPGRSFSSSPYGRYISATGVESFTNQPSMNEVNNDFPAPFQQKVTGIFYETSMSVGAWAHEIGHLMGLGDDYDHSTYRCLVDRGTSLMCDHERGSINQNLADRLSAILNIAGSLPQCWKGTLTEHAQGNIYNDTVTVRLRFVAEGRGGTITGTGRAKMTSAPQPFAGCVSTRTLTPDELEFPISGQHVGDEFHLVLPADVRLTIHITTACPPPRKSGATQGLRSLGISTDFYRPTVKAEDGATNSFHGTFRGMQVQGSIELHKARP